jgi:hypothetical protein
MPFSGEMLYIHKTAVFNIIKFLLEIMQKKHLHSPSRWKVVGSIATEVTGFFN